MIRITFMSGKLYGKRITSVRRDLENIEVFSEEGTPLIIVEDLDQLEEMGIDKDDVEMVD